ncbi:MAG: DUF167 domain-containing protein [Minisyncoccota bacterium]
MKVLVRAKPSAKVDRVVPPPARLMPEGEDWYVVQTKEKPVDGKANEAIAKLLAEHFGVAKSNVWLVSGEKSRRKVFEVRV